MSDVPQDFIKALIAGGPPSGTDAAVPAMRLGCEPGVAGVDKSFLYDIVANGRSGLDVDKLDYFARDSYFAVRAPIPSRACPTHVCMHHAHTNICAN